MVKKEIFLGHIICRDVIEVDKTMTGLIVNLFPLTYVKEVRPFLGDASYYRHFIKDFDKIAKAWLNTKSLFLTHPLSCHFQGTHQPWTRLNSQIGR